MPSVAAAATAAAGRAGRRTGGGLGDGASAVAQELAEYDEQTTGAEPRVAAAAAPHKWQAVAAGTAVGVCGKPPVDGEGAWTMVLSRRARRQ
eukprot:6920492-Prymnesium_polylepis.1